MDIATIVSITVGSGVAAWSIVDEVRSSRKIHEVARTRVYLNTVLVRMNKNLTTFEGLGQTSLHSQTEHFEQMKEALQEINICIRKLSRFQTNKNYPIKYFTGSAKVCYDYFICQKALRKYADQYGIEFDYKTPAAISPTIFDYM